MRLSMLLSLGVLALLPPRADAQVSGTIIIGGSPVGGVIHIGDRLPERRVVIVEHRAPRRTVVVHRWHKPKHWKYERFDRRVVYYDRYDGIFYDRHRPGLVRVDVIVHGGRYYVDDDRFFDRDRRDRWDRDRRDRDRGHRDRDRWDRRDRDDRFEGRARERDRREEDRRDGRRDRD